MKSIHLYIHGRVQGVGFREALRRRGEALGLAGWVRNRADGSVEATVVGTAETVETLIAWAHEGPPLAAVTEVFVRAATDAEAAIALAPIKRLPDL